MQPIVLYNFSSLERPNELWAFNPFKSHYTFILKNLPFTTKWLQYHEISEVIPDITKTGVRPTVPTIIDSNNTVVQDSWDIAKYLETAYPDSPSIFNGAESLHYFFYQYFVNYLDRNILAIIILEMEKNIGRYDHPKGFRPNIERIIGITLEEFAGKKVDQVKTLQEKLKIILGWSDLVFAGGLHMIEYLDNETLTTLVFTGEDDILSKYYYRVMNELRNRERDHAAKL
ncbi:hypothetical protein BDF14DRAFT_1958842 [Spinellus fusiger]|nr:hypothetical protein BDF14DRAFT_1958842 [Spinellus fusiger]